jgi:hypothetical protein
MLVKDSYDLHNTVKVVSVLCVEDEETGSQSQVLPWNIKLTVEPNNSSFYESKFCTFSVCHVNSWSK